MTIVFQDTFTEAVDVPLASHTPDIGTSWEVVSAPVGITIEVTGGTGNCSPDALINNDKALALANPVSALSTPNYTVRLTIGVASTGVGREGAVFGRCTSTTDGYFAIFNNSTLALYANAATPVQIGSNHTVTLVSSDVVSLVMDGTSISVELNGTPVISGTDATHSGAGRAGIGGGNYRNATRDWGNIDPTFAQFEIDVPATGPVLTQTKFRVYNDDGTGLGP